MLPMQSAIDDVLVEFRELMPEVQQLLRHGSVREAHALLGDLPTRLAEDARVRERNGDVAYAMEVWAALTDLDPWHAPWWLERGLTASRDGRDKWAVLFLARALAIDPHLEAAAAELGELQRRRARRPQPLANVIRSVVRMDASAARSTLVAAFRERPVEDLAEAIAEKVRRDGRW